MVLNSEAVIIEAYGICDFPDKNEQFMNLISKALLKDIIIVVTT